MFRGSAVLTFYNLRRFKSTSKYGMSPKEIEDLRTSWKVVNEAPIPVSKLFFKALFEQYPQYQKLFTSYQQPHQGLLLHQSEFTPHLRAVVSSLNQIIRRLEDSKSVDQVMNYIVKSHAKRKVGRTEMENFGKCVKETLRTLNKKNFSKENEEAFDKFFKGFIDHYEDVLSKEGKPPSLVGRK